MKGTEPIRTSVERRGGITVLAVAGDIDVMTAPVFQGAIDGALAGPVAALVIDLSGVDFLGSVGLRILASTHESLGDATSFAVVADGPATSRPIQLTNLDEVFALYPTLEAAVAGLRTQAD